MLPRRRIVEALPKIGLRVQSTTASRTIRSTIGHGRQFGTARAGVSSGLVGNSGLRAKASTPILTLGSVASSRNLSLWGWGSSKPTTPPPAETLSDNNVSSKTVEVPAEPASAMPSLSTSTAPGAPPAVSPAADLTTTAPVDDGMNQLVDLISQHTEDVLNRPEHIGYLKDLGLDYGWGPTSVVQWLIEHIHIYTGLGWGASIAAVAVLVRVVFFWPQVLNLRNTAKMQEMKNDARFNQSMELMKQGQVGGGQEAINKGRFIQQKLMAEYGVAYKKMLWGFAPVPFTYGLFRAINGMGSLPVPSFENAGFLWFTDLSSTDPYYILPFVSVGMMITGMKIMQRTAPADNQKAMKGLMYGMGGIMALFGLWFSAGVHVMGISLGAATLLQSILLSNSTIRHLCGLPDLAKVTTTPKEPLPTEAKYEPPRSSVEKLKDMVKDSQQGFEKTVNTFTGRAEETSEDKAIRTRRERIKKIEKARQAQEEAEFNSKYKR